MVMIQIVKMRDGNDLDNENVWRVIIQTVKMCGVNDLNSENMW